jgi:uncharacterized protein YyaL (SSP411 family)
MKLLSILLTCTLLFGSSTNALINSQSPYLLQHAHNPVNWFPWSEEALKKAKKEDKLIFLSIGYSTCHWCHVMEEESFENEEIAELLNKDFVSIKVDKEQMPHIDTHFQDTLLLLKEQRRGWPLSAVLTPNQEVIYITTYIPLVDNYGVDGMKTLLPKMVKLYRENKTEVKNIVDTNKNIILQKNIVKKNTIHKSEIANSYVALMKKRYDKIYKGFDKNPKFPLATHMQTLLDIYLLEDNKEALSMVKESIEAMSRGGIYDQVEGAFYRYSTYSDWIVPHFEKMLYTQAELILLYVKFYILFPEARYKGMVLDTISEVKKRFGHDGLFFSASNADSKKGEGRYFVYSFEEVKSAFKKAKIKNYEELMEYFDITEINNFEDGLSNVHLNTGFEKEPKNVQKALHVLRELRAHREFPFVDKKVLTGWNALMIKSLFIASYFDKNLIKDAEKSMRKLLEKVYIQGELYHGFLYNNKSIDRAVLEDYVFLIDLLQTAYMYTQNRAYLLLAGNLQKETLRKFYVNKTFYLDDTNFKAKATYGDKYYVSPLSRLYHTLFTQANLTYDLKLLAQTRGYLADERDKILKSPDNASEAIRALLRSNAGDVVIKSNKKNMLSKQKDILQIKYPFILQTTQNTDKYLACDEKTCFAIDKEFKNIVKYIQTYKEETK